MRNDFYGAFDQERIEGEKPLREGEHRSPFQIDRDRIIHTSAFRRLQNKTQVFFSGEYDFYRTRLTHSIEVAQIGRSLCDRLNRTSPLLGPESFLDADLVEGGDHGFSSFTDHIDDVLRFAGMLAPPDPMARARRPRTRAG